MFLSTFTTIGDIGSNMFRRRRIATSYYIVPYGVIILDHADHSTFPRQCRIKLFLQLNESFSLGKSKTIASHICPMYRSGYEGNHFLNLSKLII